MQLIEQVSHDHGIDLIKLQREFDIKWAIEQEQAHGQLFGPFHRKYILDRAPEKVQKILATLGSGSDVICAAQSFTALDMPFPTASLRAAINTTTTETNLWDPALLAPLPVGSIVAGRAWSVNFGGVMGTTGTPVISFRARCGTNNSAPPTGADLGVGPTVTLATISAVPFFGQGVFGCRTAGVAASGATITGNGFVACPGAAAGTSVVAMFGGLLTATTVDAYAAQGLSVSVIWGTSNASNTLTPHWLAFGACN